MKRPSPVPVLLLALVAGCIEFTDATLPAEPVSETEAFLFLTSRDAPTEAELHIAGRVNLADAQGARFVDDTLRVLGRSVAPQYRAPSIRSYDRVLTLPAGTLEREFTVKLPTTAGVRLPRAEVSVRAPARLGPDTLTQVPGGDLVLPIRAGAVDGLQAVSEQWNVTVERGSRRFNAHAFERVPMPLRIPAAWIPADTAREIVVRLMVQGRFHATDESRLTVMNDAELRWKVRAAP